MIKLGTLINPVQVHKEEDIHIGFLISDLDEYYSLESCLNAFTNEIKAAHTVCISGIGITCALLASIDLYRQGITNIINIGSAGSRVYARGMVMQPKYYLQADAIIAGVHNVDPCRLYAGHVDFRSLQPTDICYSSNSFITSVEQVKGLPVQGTHDMEAYGIALASMHIGRQFYSIKIVTDNLDFEAHHTSYTDQLMNAHDAVAVELDKIYKDIKTYYKLED